MKNKLSKIGDQPASGGTSVGGEGSVRTALSLRSEPGITAEAGVGGGNSKVGGVEDDPRPGDSQSVSLRSVVGTGHDLGGSDDNVSGRETGQSRPYLQSNLQTESECIHEKRDADRVDSPPQSNVGDRTPTPSISRGGESEST